MGRVGSLALAVLAAGCSTGLDPQPLRDATEVVPATLPLPVDDVVLTVRGDVSRPNVGSEAHIDLDGIESLGLETVEIFEPFISDDVEFSGVPLETVLAAVGVEPHSPLTWTALDDYQVHFTLADLAGQGAFLATRQDDEAISIADGGPIRVVFTNDDGDIGRDTNQWIWSLTTVEVGSGDERD